MRDHHRHMVRRKLKADGAGGGQRQIGGGEGGALVLGRLDHQRRDLPARGKVADKARHALDRRQDDAQVGFTVAQPRDGLFKARGKAADLALPRAGQAEEDRLIGTDGVGVAKGRRLICRPAPFGHDRMADEIAAHPGGFHIGRLEREQRKHMVHGPGHLRRAAGAPGPDGRRDVMGDELPRIGGADKARDAQAEIGAVDGDQRVGLQRGHGGGGLGDAALQLAVFRQDLNQPHDRKLLHREQALQPLGLHLRAADTVKFHPRRQSLHPRHQRRPQSVARGFTGDQEDFHGSRAQRNSPAAAAAATIAGRSRRITPPASHAIPARPALAARSTVPGPSVGRSIRRS